MLFRRPGWLHALFLTLVLTLAFSRHARSQAPEPSPTDAAAVAAQRLTADGTAPLPVGLTVEKGREPARQAALLSAMRKLLEQALAHGDYAGADLKPAAGVRKIFRISPEHPNDALLAWLLRSQIRYDESQPGKIAVQLQSPPLGELAGGFPHLSKSTPFDLDGDGQPETIGAGFDGRLYVLRKTVKGFDVLSASPSQAYYTCNTYGPDWEAIRLSRLEGIRSVEAAGPKRARVVVDVRIDEAVCGEYAGGAVEQREVLVGLQDEAGPEIKLEEPFDFSGTSEESIPMRGVLSAPAGVSVARLHFNGRPVWQTPEGLRSKQLKMDLMVPLLPGLNRAQLQALDQQKRLVTREVVVRRNAGVAPVDPARRQAVVVGIESYAKKGQPSVGGAERDATRVRDALIASGGFKADRVKLLIGEQATREAVLTALKGLRDTSEGQARGLAVVYFAGLSVPGADGKSLQTVEGGEISARDLITAVGPLDSQEALFLGDCARLPSARAEGVWLDGNDFLTALERSGWAAVASPDPLVDEREGDDGSLFASSLVTGLKGSAELDELYRFLFARLQEQVRKRKLAPQVPLWRGEILGRVPVGTPKVVSSEK